MESSQQFINKLRPGGNNEYMSVATPTPKQEQLLMYYECAMKFLAKHIKEATMSDAPEPVNLKRKRVSAPGPSKKNKIS